MLTFQTSDGRRWRLRFKHSQERGQFRGVHGLLDTWGWTEARLEDGRVVISRKS